MQKVFFHYADRNLPIKNKKNIKIAIQDLFVVEKIILGRIDYIFCSDNHLLNINKQFLSHNYYTDIITFDLSEKKELLISEIYISVDRIIDNSNALKTKTIEEFQRVIFHGALHLCGYTDKNKKGTKRMREKENYYILYCNSLKIPRESVS